VSEFRLIKPCGPIRAKAVPAGDGWLHEVKFDGYRVQVHKLGSRRPQQYRARYCRCESD